MHVDGGHRQKPIDFQRRHFQNGRLAAILDFLVSRPLLYCGFEYQLQTSAAQYLCIWVGAYWFSATPLSKWLPGGHIGFSVSRVGRRHGFRSISQVCFGISVSNLMYMLMVVIGRSLMIFNDVTFKMAAWQPYWISWFPDCNFNLALNVNSKLQWHSIMYMGRSLLIFSSVNFKMAAWQSYWIFWFPDSNFSLALNVNSKLQRHNTYVYG